MAPTNAPAWYWDPAARHQWRYFDGTRWTEHVADNGLASTDPIRLDAEANRQRPRRTVLWVAVGLMVALLAIYIIAAVAYEASGVAPIDRLHSKRSALTSAGIECTRWSETSHDMIFVGSHASGTCTLSSGQSFEITTFRENTNKDYATAPCPRLDGDAFWVDLSAVHDAAMISRVANALAGSVTATCGTPTA